MNLRRFVLLLWGVFYLILGPILVPGDGDLYWQRWLGTLVLQTRHLPTALGKESLTAAGAWWVPQEWLFSTIVALTSGHGLFILLVIAMSAAPLVILNTIARRCGDEISPEATGVALLFCGIALLASFGVRAQVLGWVALAAFMFFLERRDRWYYAAFPTAIVWANLHASVLIAPVILAMRLLAALFEGGRSALRYSRDARMLPAVLLAICCTPLGWRLPAYAIALVASPIRHFIVEWNPSGPGNVSFLCGAFPLAVSILLAGRSVVARQKLLLFPSVALFAAMVFAQRNIALFAIVAAPLAARALDLRFATLHTIAPKVRELAPAALVATGITGLLSMLALRDLQRAAPPKLPLNAVAALAHDRMSHRLFCEDFTWCSIALGYPRIRVFIDGRCDAYPLSVWRRYIAAATLEPRWSGAFDQYAVDAVLAARSGRLAAALSKETSWRPAFEDAGYVLFRRYGTSLSHS